MRRRGYLPLGTRSGVRGLLGLSQAYGSSQRGQDGQARAAMPVLLPIFLVPVLWVSGPCGPRRRAVIVPSVCLGSGVLWCVSARSAAKLSGQSALRSGRR